MILRVLVLLVLFVVVFVIGVVNGDARGSTSNRKHNSEIIQQAEDVLETNVCLANGGDEDSCRQERYGGKASTGSVSRSTATTTSSDDEYYDIVGSINLGEVQDIAGKDAAKVKVALQDTVTYYTEVLSIDPEFVNVKTKCKNRHKLCTFWKVIGECEANPNYMQKDCALACQSCLTLDHNKRCPVNQTHYDTDVWKKPGDLNAMFERIVNGEEFQKYTPTILSRPKVQDDTITSKSAFDDDEDKVDDNLDGPWVITLENFLTEHECQTLIELGHEEGYERSADVGKEKFDGTFEQDVNDGRTSLNAWCQNDVCYKNTTTLEVLKKLEYLTGIPEKNSEHLQLLKYEVDEYYQEHHDYIGYQKNRQQGARIITVFLYLNDVEQGGGTHFPKLIDPNTKQKGITVYPKRGRVLIWPSVKNDSPNDKDFRTYHEALPVEKGTKFGANAWLHMRDYKTPFDTGCQ